MTMSSRLAVLVLVAVASCLQAHGRDLSSTPHAVVELFRHNDTTNVASPRNEGDDEWLCNTIVTVKTGDYWRAGTDSAIIIFLKGESGPLLKFITRSSSAFERGSVDVFIRPELYTCPWRSGVGFRPCFLRIVSDGSGISPDWFCEYVDVTVAEIREDSTLVFYQTRFTPNRWIGPNSGTKSIEINQCASSMAAVA